MPYKNIVLSGAGNIGGPILNSLAETGVSVTLLSRFESTPVPSGVKVAKVDYEDHAGLVASLKRARAEVVVSTLGREAFAAQTKLAKAAKEAGVKLFVPSEFGNPTLGLTQAKAPFLHPKIQFQSVLKELDLPYSLFYTGLLAEWIPLVLGLDVKSKTARIVGKGDTPLSSTSPVDIGRYVAHVLTTLPEEDLAWRIFRIQGDRKSWNEVVTIVENIIGDKIAVDYVDREQTARESLAEGPAGLVKWLSSEWDLGHGVSTYNPSTDRDDLPDDLAVWPQWKPKSVEEILAANIKK